MLHPRHERRGPGSIQEMKRVCQQWTRDRQGNPIVGGSWFNRCILRRVSIYVTWALVTLGISAHTATVCMILSGVVGAGLCLFHAPHLTVLGAVFLVLFDLLDAVDGEIARWNETSCTQGLFLDQVAHVLVVYPSSGIAALHCYLVTQNDVYGILAAVAAVGALMGGTFREVMLQINAETLCRQRIETANDSREPEPPRFKRFCNYLRSNPLTAFPIDKGRVIHIVTVAAIFASYAGSMQLLIFVSWFYAIYGPARSLAEIPHYYLNRIIDVEHSKPVQDYKWPL